MTLEIAHLSADELNLIFDSLSPLEARAAACVCRRWQQLVSPSRRRLLAVTSAGSNEIVLFDARGRVVQRFTALPPPQRRQRRGGGRTYRGVSSWRQQRGAGNWPTCLAFGPRGELFVSQYRVRGVLQFERSPHGYCYRRTVASAASLSSPEGICCAHGSLYLACVDRGVIVRLALAAGALLEETRPFEGTAGEMYVYWGMALGPDGHLYVAAHVSEEGGHYLRPTPIGSGRVLRQRLSASGSFLGPTEVFAGRGGSSRRQLNRPSDPCFCSHGNLHISSFVAPGGAASQAAAEGMRRVVYTFSPQGDCLGYLRPSAGASLIRDAWGVSCAVDGGSSLLVACQGEDPASEEVLVRLPSCGCGELLATERASAPDASRPIACGEAASLVGADACIKCANYVANVPGSG